MSEKRPYVLLAAKSYAPDIATVRWEEFERSIDSPPCPICGAPKVDSVNLELEAFEAGRRLMDWLWDNTPGGFADGLLWSGLKHDKYNSEEWLTKKAKRARQYIQDRR